MNYELIFRKESLLHDIANMAYVIADKDNPPHSIHRVADICQEGNIDRVSRILGLAYAKVRSLLAPILDMKPVPRINRFSETPHTYILRFHPPCRCRNPIGHHQLFRLRETIHEYMVCMVLADWLGITLPEEAPVWIRRAEKCFEAISAILTEITTGGALLRRVPPI